MQDFLYANFHTHTTRCLHAADSEREYIENAIDMGMKRLGFADHIPCPFEDGYVSNIRMKMSRAPEYVSTLRKLGEEYKADIDILVGFEAEYIPEFFPAQKKMCQDLGVDYLIMGQHFWEPENRGYYTGTKTDSEKNIRTYVDSVIAGMKTGMFKYLAHPDLINYQGLDSVYEWEMTRLCKAMKEMTIPLEINLLGLYEGRHYPSDRFFRIAAEVGNDVIIGIDAHWASQIKNRNAYLRALDIVDRYSLNLIDDLDIK